jgi:putative FmdB family regulatory protein
VPIYEYRCTNGHNFEVIASMTDDPVRVCPECGAKVERVFHPVAVHFKGSGFYSTDYGRARGGGGDSKGSDSKGSDSQGSDSKSSDSKPSKEPAKAESSSGSEGSSSSSTKSSD